MLSTFIEKDRYLFEEEFASWEDAIEVAYQPLIKEGIVEASYIEAVIACVKKYGPYIIIAPNIAMPHASEGAVGVNGTAISFMKVEKPVRFDEEDREKDAQLFFVLAAVNHEEHLKNMMELSEMLLNEDLVKDLETATNKNDLERIAAKYNV